MNQGEKFHVDINSENHRIQIAAHILKPTNFLYWLMTDEIFSKIKFGNPDGRIKEPSEDDLKYDNWFS